VKDKQKGKKISDTKAATHQILLADQCQSRSNGSFRKTIPQFCG